MSCAFQNASKSILQHPSCKLTFKLIPNRFRVSLDYDHRRHQTCLSDGTAHAIQATWSEKQMVADSFIKSKADSTLVICVTLCNILSMSEKAKKLKLQHFKVCGTLDLIGNELISPSWVCFVHDSNWWLNSPHPQSRPMSLSFYFLSSACLGSDRTALVSIWHPDWVNPPQLWMSLEENVHGF